MLTKEQTKLLPYYFKEKQILSLDGLRAVSIILVIINHVALNYPGSVVKDMGFGSLGVNIFFVISGFLITFLLLKEKMQYGNISLKNFYGRRVLRIIPVAYLFILVLFLLNYRFNLSLGTGTFLRPLFFCENFVDHPTYGPAIHYWSLGVEEQFYLIFPWLLTKGIKIFLRVAIALFFLVPVIVYTNYHLPAGMPWLQMPMNILNSLLGKGMLSILTGCIAAILVFKFPGKFSVKFKYATLIQAGLFMATWFFNQYNWPAGINNIMLSISIAMLLLSVINNRENIVFRILNSRIVRYIGTISYSLYIWQQIFAFQQPWANTGFPGRSIPINLFLLLITAMVSYHGYEKQFLKLKTRFYRVHLQAKAKDNAYAVL